MFNGKQVNICITTLNNYQGLAELISSIECRDFVPDFYYIFDNGKGYPFNLPPNSKIIHPPKQVALAASWNWFAKNVPEIRIILNDDLVFYDTTLIDFLNGMSNDEISFPTGVSGLNAFSFFSLPDSVYEKVGPFDEEFYPAYYEDNDYFYRITLNGGKLHAVNNVTLFHAGSQTIKNYSPQEMEIHHKLFRKNTEYYQRKWGGLPGNEKFTDLGFSPRKPRRFSGGG